MTQVGMEDGAELVRTLLAAQIAEFREGLPIQVLPGGILGFYYC